jgi:hypothetical protein
VGFEIASDHHIWLIVKGSPYGDLARLGCSDAIGQNGVLEIGGEAAKNPGAWDGGLDLAVIVRESQTIQSLSSLVWVACLDLKTPTRPFVIVAEEVRLEPLAR